MHARVIVHACVRICTLYTHACIPHTHKYTSAHSQTTYRQYIRSRAHTHTHTYMKCVCVCVCVCVCEREREREREREHAHQHDVVLLGDSGGVVNSLDFCPASLKSLGCFNFRCVLSSQWKAVTVNLRILHCQR